MKKKILALTLIVAMLGVALIGGTLAYFTDKEVEDNEFVIGDIRITLKESNGLPEGDTNYAENDDDASTTDDAYDKWLEKQTLFPGAPIAKNVWVENAGENEAYLRVKITVPEHLVAVWAQDLNAAWTIASTTVNADGSTTYVVEYNTILAKGETTPICLEAITIDPYTDKQINGADIQTVNVVAEAIQTVGFADADAAFAALDAQLTVNEYEGKNYVQAADDTALAAALAGAQPGDVIALAAGVDYGTITLDATNSLEGVAIVGTGANDQIEIVAGVGAVLKDVTIANMDLDFEYQTGSYRGVINITGDAATVENLLIKDSTFVGEGARSAGVGIFNSNATVTIENCVFEGSKYAVYGSTPAVSVTVKDCDFRNLDSWAILLNGAPSDGSEMTITNCTFDNCKDGIAKTLGDNVNATVAFTNNTLTNCAGHDGSDAKWFTLLRTATASGNTLDGAAWTPTAAQGFGK